MAKKIRQKISDDKKILIFVVLFIILCALIYWIPMLNGSLASTYTAVYEEVNMTDEVTLYFARNETVYLTESAGSPNLNYKEGELVKGGSTVMSLNSVSLDSDDMTLDDVQKAIISGAGHKFTTKTSSFNAKKSGIVSYAFDENISLFDPEKLDALTEEKLKDINTDTSIVNKKTILKPGQAAFKIIDNHEWWMLCFFDSEAAENYKEDQSVSIHVGSNDVTARVKKLVAQRDARILVIFETNNYLDGFGSYRMEEATITRDTYSGVVLETDSIIAKDGKVGVYIKNKLGEQEFREIKIIDQNDDVTIVEKSYFYDNDDKPVQTVNVYDEIIRQ